LFSVVTSAQKITTSIDSSQIKIGSQFNLIIKASVNAKDKVVFPDGKFFGALEILESYPELEEEDIRQALNYAAWAVSDRVVSFTSA
jgi:hypothetical protein